MHINRINPRVQGFSEWVFQLSFFLLYQVMVEKKQNPFLLLFKEVQQIVEGYFVKDSSGVSLSLHNMGNNISRALFVNQNLMGLFVPSHVFFSHGPTIVKLVSIWTFKRFYKCSMCNCLGLWRALKICNPVNKYLSPLFLSCHLLRIGEILSFSRVPGSHCIFLLSWMRSFTQSYLAEIGFEISN
ncbi:hypothetical protein AMTRI_Chr09g36550 [Amborella trichopoda]